MSWKRLCLALPVVTLVLPTIAWAAPGAATKPVTAAQTKKTDTPSNTDETCSSPPVFTMSKLNGWHPDCKMSDPTCKTSTRVVLNIKGNYTGTMYVTIWQGLAAQPAAGECEDQDAKGLLSSPDDFLHAGTCTSAKRLFPPEGVDPLDSPLKVSSATNGADNEIVFENFPVSDAISYSKVLVYFETVTTNGNTACSKDNTGAVVATLADMHTFEFDSGVVAVMQKKPNSSSTGGNFKEQPEFAFTSKGIWGSATTVYSDLRYAYIGQSSSSGSNNQQQPTSQVRRLGEVKDDSSTSTDNPFQSGGGTLRGNFYVSLPTADFRPKNASVSGIAGVGFTTLPDTAGVHAPLRGFAGMRFDVPDLGTESSAANYGGSSGYIQAGYAYDNFWGYDKSAPAVTGGPEIPGQRNRLWLEAQIRLPNNVISVSPRLYVDVPAVGHGDVDLRVSLLATVDATKLSNYFGAKSSSAGQ